MNLFIIYILNNFNIPLFICICLFICLYLLDHNNFKKKMEDPPIMAAINFESENEIENIENENIENKNEDENIENEENEEDKNIDIQSQLQYQNQLTLLLKNELKSKTAFNPYIYSIFFVILCIIIAIFIQIIS